VSKNNCTNCGRQRSRVCDTCVDPTCKGCAVILRLGSTSAEYTECPTCVAERSEEEEHGPKSVSIKSIVPDTEPRLAPGIMANSTVWADGLGFRRRQWSKRGVAP